MKFIITLLVMMSIGYAESDTAVVRVDTTKQNGLVIYTNLASDDSVVYRVYTKGNDTTKISMYRTGTPMDTIVDSMVINKYKTGTFIAHIKIYGHGRIMSTVDMYRHTYKSPKSIFGKKDTTSYNEKILTYQGDDSVSETDNYNIAGTIKLAYKSQLTQHKKILQESKLYPFIGRETRSYNDSGMEVETYSWGITCKGHFDRLRIKGKIECSDSIGVIKDTLYRSGEYDYTVHQFRSEQVDSIEHYFGLEHRYLTDNKVYIDNKSTGEQEWDSAGIVTGRTTTKVNNHDTITISERYGDINNHYRLTSYYKTINGIYEGEQKHSNDEFTWVETSSWKHGKLISWRRNGNEHGVIYIYGKCKNNVCSVFNADNSFLRCSYVNDDGNYDFEELPRTECGY